MSSNNNQEIERCISGLLVDNCCVLDETEKDYMYALYTRQMKKEGIEPVEKKRILFLSSGMSCRDEDREITRDHAREEANQALSRLYKIYDTELDTVVLRVGLEPEVYVARFPFETKAQKAAQPERTI